MIIFLFSFGFSISTTFDGFPGIDFSFAGTETTSNTLAVALYLLSIDQTRLLKLQAEVDEAIPDPDTCIDLSTARTMPYLDAVLKESVYARPRRT